jgi:predicted dehydrogenase
MLAAEKLDVVSVCTPNKFHQALALAAFAAGCHVLCEKPMAMNAAEGRTMLAAAKKAGKRLMINFSYRFSAASRGLKTQVDSGMFGDFYFGRTVWHRRRGMPGFGGWFGTKALAGGGPLIDLGVHRLDLALWLMGYPKPTWVMGNTYDPIARRLADAAGKHYDVEDLAAAFIRFENGATLVVEASWAANIQEAELMETRLLGTKAGLLQKNLNEGYQFDAHVFTEQNGAQFDMHLHPPTTPANSGMHDFAQAILTDTPHPASGEEGLVVMELLDAIYESARSGAPVRL